MKKKIRKRTVPKTTNNITKGIVHFLLIEGHCASRVNTQGQFEPANAASFSESIGGLIKALRASGLIVGRWRKSGSRKGFLDINATIRTRSGLGLSLYADVKFGDDELNDDQIEFVKEAQAAGAIVFPEVRDLEHFKELYASIVVPMINKY